MLFLAVPILAGCDTSSLFSEGEKSSIYTLSFTASETKLAGAAVNAGDAITVSVKAMSGAAEAGTLSLSLESSDGTELAELEYLSAKSSGVTGAKSVSVDKVSGTLPEFALPEDLKPGSYRLVAKLYSLSGAQISTSDSVFFIARTGFGLGSVSLYPPTPAPGSAVLLSAIPELGSAAARTAASTSARGTSGTSSSGTTANTISRTGSTEVSSTESSSTADIASTAYLKWYAGGKLFSEGLLSEGADKVVWRAPQLEGAYTLSVELYPAEPPASSSSSRSAVTSPWRQDIKAIVSKSAALADEYSDLTRFVSKFDFEGDFSDSGTRIQSEKPVSFGKPELEAYPGGFGYHFDAESGVNAPGALPRNSKFTLLSRFYSEKESGDLIRFASADGTSILRVGIDKRELFAEVRDSSGSVSRSSPSSSRALIQPGLTNVALSFEPDGEDFRLVWSIDGGRFGSAPLPRVAFDSSDKCVIGGASALEAVYDETAISDDSSLGPPPLYAAGASRLYGADLYIASGFESITVPEGAELSGTAAYAARKLTLAPAAELAYSEALPSARALHFEADFGGKAASALRFSFYNQDNGDALFFSVDAHGNIYDAQGKTAGLIPLDSSSSLVFSLKSVEDGFEFASSSGLPVAKIAVEGHVTRLKLKIRNSGTTESVDLSRLLVRAAPEYLSFVPASYYARANNK